MIQKLPIFTHVIKHCQNFLRQNQSQNFPAYEMISVFWWLNKKYLLIRAQQSLIKTALLPQLKKYRVLFPLIKYRLKWGGHATRKNALCLNVRNWLKCLISYWEFNGVPEIHLPIILKEHLVENPCHATTHARPLHPARCLRPHSIIVLNLFFLSSAKYLLS